MGTDPTAQTSEKPLPGLEPFFDEFLRDRTEECNGELSTALATSDFEAIRRLAHKWKGFCEPYGFGGLGQMAIRLEQQAAAQNMAECQKLFEQIQAYLATKALAH